MNTMFIILSIFARTDTQGTKNVKFYTLIIYYNE